MGRSLGEILREELKNLEKDAHSRISAMKALTSCVKGLDSRAIPLFVAQICETKHTTSSSAQHIISLYAILARVHGPKIIGQIDNIMNYIENTLCSSHGDFSLHQSCSKVITAIARYAIDPRKVEESKRDVIQGLCQILAHFLLRSENVSSGAALCLEALVQSDNWRYASKERVTEVCDRVVGTLESHSHPNSHLALITTLVKHNRVTVQPYCSLLLESGRKILECGFAEGNYQKQHCAIHMLRSLLRCLDPKSTGSELKLVIEVLKKCQSGRMPYVTIAALEALQFAKRIFADNGLNTETELGSATDLNLDRRENTRRSFITYPDQSQTVYSAARFNCFAESSDSVNQGYQNLPCHRRSVDRKDWPSSQNGVDISLIDGNAISSDITPFSELMNSDYDPICHIHGTVRTNTPSPDRSNSRSNIDDLKIFSTPRGLMESLQDPDDDDLCSPNKETRNSQERDGLRGLTDKTKKVLSQLWKKTNMSSGRRYDCSSDLYNDEDPRLKLKFIVLLAVLVYLWVTSD